MLKKIKSLFIFVFVLVFCGSLVSCSKEENSSSSNGIQDQFDCITVSKAIDIANEAGSNGTEDSYYVYGKVKEITNFMFGEMYITDGTKDLYVYGVQGDDGTHFDKLEDQPEEGDEVVLYGPLQVYKDKPELKKCKLKAMTHAEKEPLDLTKYAETTIATTRTKEKGSKVMLNGVVGFITKGSGFTPNGFYLIDETGSTYVYDPKAAASVKVGQKIKLAGETNLFVNPKEQDAANKFNYKGAFQITDAIVVENDKGDTEFDKSWVKESTIKDMMESKDYTNMTGNIFKVNAFIHKAVADDHTNYYFNDLDDKTGSYVYTTNNGKDFMWLDNYDGKICTVYLSVLNYKSTTAKVTPRFIPLAVKDEKYSMPKTEIADFVLDYEVVDQFKSVYNADPEQEMLTTYSNAKLGFENVVISYTSSNGDVFTFDEVNGKTILHTKNEGKSKITVKAQYETYSATREFEISYNTVDITAAKTVKEAVDAQLDTTLMIKGIVTSSLVNKSGFYISDETGVIAVLVNEELLPEFAIGNEVVIEGKRVNKGKFDYKGNERDVFGTSAFECTKLVTNLQGNNAYSDSIIVKDQTIDSLFDVNIKEEYTSTIYEVKCKVVLPEGQMYAVYQLQSLTDDTKYIQLYCSGKDQYRMLKEYTNQEVTMHITLCNWNGKSHYKACVVAVIDGDNRVVNNLNFQ